jgi:hypothetical protein
MSRFTWWRRERPRKKLTIAQAKKNKLKSVAQQQLEYGNFDISPFYNQAQNELKLRDKALAEFCANSKGERPEQDIRYREIWKKHQVRYLKLMEDYHNDELRTLGELRRALIDEFEIDVWDEVIEYALKNDISGAKEFYISYNNIASKHKQQA